jgi:hypothetical protein
MYTLVRCAYVFERNHKPLGLHVPAVLSAYIIERVRHLSKRAHFGGLHKRLKDVAILDGRLTQRIKSLRRGFTAAGLNSVSVVDLLFFFVGGRPDNLCGDNGRTTF